MAPNRANELRRQIARTLRGSDAGSMDEWTRRELRRSARRLRAIERHEAEERHERETLAARSRRHAEHEAREAERRGDHAAADYWTALADASLTPEEMREAIADPRKRNLGAVGAALARAARGGGR